ncbi:MAG: transketolase C-terminal domain-containing protein [Casimicrobiaceae bacterium]
MSADTTLKPRAMRDALLASLHLDMQRNSDIFFVTADFGSPVLDSIRADRPDRFINVGIAEQNLINVSAGLALEGFTVFAYAIAPFITMRCFEQIRVNLALLSEVRSLNVNLIGVGAGYSYVVSGPTHQCYEDLTLMRALPNMQVLSPSDHVAAAALASHCIARPGPKYVRLDAQVLPVLYDDEDFTLDDGFRVHATGGTVCLIATGYMVHTTIKVAQRLSRAGVAVGVIDLFDITGFDEDKLADLLSGYRGVVTLEEGFAGRGGLDAMMFDWVARRGMPLAIRNVGVSGRYLFELGTREQLHERVGIGADAVYAKVAGFVDSLASARR